jgi:hypothetical protein
MTAALRAPWVVSSRRRQGVLDGPAQDVESLPEKLGTDAKAPAPLADRRRLPVEGDETVTPLVLRLLTGGRPAAVLRAVRPVDVDAVDAVLLRWARPHVGQEVLEAVPPLTHRDAAPTIIGIGCVLRIRAASAHPRPNDMLRRVAQAVGKVCSAGALAMEATTRACGATRQVALSDDDLATTRADASPLAHTSAPLDLFDHGESIELSPEQIHAGLWGSSHSDIVPQNRLLLYYEWGPSWRSL